MDVGPGDAFIILMWSLSLAILKRVVAKCFRGCIDDFVQKLDSDFHEVLCSSATR
jgi:hypothetical protein